MNSLIIFFILFNFNFIYAEIQNSEIDSLENLNLELSTKIKKAELNILSLNNKIISQKSDHDNTLNSISTLISTSSYIVSGFGILFAAIALYLGWFINKKSEKIKEFLEESKIIEKKIIELKYKIDNDTKQLFLDLRKEDTTALVDRLYHVPQDISNLGQVILTRPLDRNHFFKLNQAFKKLNSIDQIHDIDTADNRDDYLIVFFQNFMFLCLDDEVLRNHLFNRLDVVIKSTFYNDITKSTKDLCKYINEKGLENNKEFLIKYLTLLLKSKYSKDKSLFNIVFIALNDIAYRFGILELLLNSDTIIALKEWMISIEAEYSNNELSEFENNILVKARELIKSFDSQKSIN